MDEILKRLEKIEKLIESQNLVRKDVLNFNECCDYLELSQSHHVQANQYRGYTALQAQREENLFQKGGTG